MRTTGLTEIITLAEKLNPEEKLQLIEHLMHDLQRTPQSPPRLSWREACGLGKAIWEGVEVNRYIDILRDEWVR